MAKFDPSRVTGGTIELVRNPDGSYKSQVTGFTQIASLNLPDITTTAATTTSDATTAAAEKAQENLETQTSAAFTMPSVMQKDQTNQQDLSGEMTKEAAQTSKLLTETFKEPVEIKSPTAPLYDDFPEKQTTTAPDAVTGSPISNILNEAKVKEDDTTITLSKARIRGPRDLDRTQTTTTRTPQGMDPLGLMRPREERDQRFTDDAGRVVPAYDDQEYPQLDTALGITTKTTAPDAVTEGPKKETLGITVPADRDLEADIGAQPREDIQSRPVKQSALKTIAETVKRNFKNIKVPSVVGTVLRAVAGPMTPTQKHAQKYFNTRDDGRIAGNPNEDLYAGMNRVSAFGNLQEAGANRISTREKTIEKKGYGPGDKFYDDTQKMKNQQKDYVNSLQQDQGSDESRALSDPTRSVTYGSQGPVRTDIDVADSGAESSGGKIVCTMMNKSYGFGSFRNKIWLRHSKNLAPEYQIGYHKIFLPLVKKSKTNKFIKKILEHIAIHRTIDIRKEEKNKIHLLGRIYRKILEPICYLVGRLWR